MKFLSALPIICLMAPVFLSSCIDNDPEDNCGIFLPVKITCDRNGISETESFVYDTQSRCVVYEYVYYGGKAITSITYNKDGKVDKVEKQTIQGNYTWIEKYRYTYKGNLILQEYTGSDGHTYPKDSLFVDNKERLFRMVVDQTEVTGLLYDPAGNISVDSISFRNRLYVNTYRYDNHPGICSRINMPDWTFFIFLHKYQHRVNNVLVKASTHDAYTYRETSGYTYNESGYPVEIQYEDDYGDKSVSFIEYVHIR